MNLVHSQNTLILSKFEQLAECTTFKQFDTKARELGYSYYSKSTKDDFTAYDYLKSVSTTYLEGEIGLSYLDYGDGNPIIYLSGSSTFLNNQVENLKHQLQYSNPKYFEFEEGCSSTGDNTIVFCYQSSKYKLMMYDTPKKTAQGSRYNYYKIKIWKR